MLRTHLHLIVIVALLTTGSLRAQSTHYSVVHDANAMSSEILKGERRYATYLPPGYHTSRRSYPVLYLLHGGGDDQTGWVQYWMYPPNSPELERDLREVGAI